MKVAIVFVLMTLLGAGTALAAGDKLPDTQDFVLQAANRVQIAGSLTDSSPVWDRGYGYNTPEPENCNYQLVAAYYQGQFYDLHCIRSADMAPVEIVVNPLTTLDDTTLHIFCAGFDPALPLDNCVFYDDDDGEGLLSAITAGDNVVLTPGVDYWLILSNYGVGDPGDMGDYVIDTSDNVVLCGGVATEHKGWGAIKALYR